MRSSYLQENAEHARLANICYSLPLIYSPRLAKTVLHQASQSAMGEPIFTLRKATGGAQTSVKTLCLAETTRHAGNLMRIYFYRGRNGQENNTLGACAAGYSGILCSDCNSGFYLSGSSYKCTACPD